MTFSELAAYLDVPRRALYRLLENGAGFPAYKVNSKWYADLEEVQEWLLRACEKMGVINS
jgi:excisionase family DNA binding protein